MEMLKTFFGNGIIQAHPHIAAGAFGLLTGIVGGLASWRLERFVRGVRHNEQLLQQVLYVRPGRIGGIEEYLKELCAIDGDGKRGLAISFAVESLRRISTTGFIQADVEVRDYVRFLKECCKQSTKRLFATCTVRPLWFYQASGRSDHLEPFRMGRHPGFGGRIRVVVLSDQDVASIVRDTIINLVQGRQTGSSDAYDLPEAQFFMDKVADTADKCIVYWALQSELADLGRGISEWFEGIRDAKNLIPDYVVFDEELILRFVFNGQQRGLMSLLWGQHIERHSKPFLELRRLDPSPPRVGRATAATPPNLQAHGFFRTMNELLSSRLERLGQNPYLQFSLESANGAVCSSLGVDETWNGSTGFVSLLRNEIHKKIVDGLAHRRLAIRSGFSATSYPDHPEPRELAEPGDWDRFLEEKQVGQP